MYQRDLVRKAWGDAGLYRRRDEKIARFLKSVDECPADCWPELVDEVRSRYPEYLREFVKPIWDTGDELLRLNLVRHADPENEAEQELLLFLVKSDLRGGRDDRLLRAAVRRGNEAVVSHITKKRDVPFALRQEAVLRAERMKSDGQ